MAPPIRLPTALYSRISLVLLPVLLGLGALQFVLFSSAIDTLAKETLQRVNVSLAAEIAADLSPSVRGSSVNLSEIEERFAALRLRYPTMDFYLLDPEGALLLWSPPDSVPRSVEVSTRPIRAFLDTAQASRLPMYGPDPADSSRDQVFSAAALKAGSQEYLLYIVLTGASFRSALSALSSGYTVKTSLFALLSTTLVAALCGFALFFILTARLRRLSGLVTKIEAGAYDTVLPAEGTDEIAHLSRSVRSMAARIVASLREKEEVDALRRRLVAQISHDIRGPLTGVRSRLEALNEALKSSAPVEQTSLHAQRALSAMDTAQSLLDDLFELSKLEAKERPLQCETFSLLELAGNEVQQLSLRTRQTGVAVRLEPGSADTMVYADALLLQRVMRNLIDNAVKATPAGGFVTIRFQNVSEGLLVEVIDTGRGMSEEEQAKLFTEFFTSDPVHGSGLGLVIIKKILEAHGTEPRVVSSPGQGSSFSFVLRRRAQNIS